MQHYTVGEEQEPTGGTLTLSRGIQRLSTTVGAQGIHKSPDKTAGKPPALFRKTLNDRSRDTGNQRRHLSHVERAIQQQLDGGAWLRATAAYANARCLPFHLFEESRVRSLLIPSNSCLVHLLLYLATDTINRSIRSRCFLPLYRITPSNTRVTSAQDTSHTSVCLCLMGMVQQ